MKVEVSMTKDETKFTSERWWASTPEFVLYTLGRQLKAAAAIWLELEDWKLSINPELDPTRPAAPALAEQPKERATL